MSTGGQETGLGQALRDMGEGHTQVPDGRGPDALQGLVMGWGGGALGSFLQEGTERRSFLWRLGGSVLRGGTRGEGGKRGNVPVSEVGANTPPEASEHSLPPGTAPASFQALSQFPSLEPPGGPVSQPHETQDQERRVSYFGLQVQGCAHGRVCLLRGNLRARPGGVGGLMLYSQRSQRGPQGGVPAQASCRGSCLRPHPGGQHSPQGQDTGREVVAKQEGGTEELARPHGHVGHSQSHCLIQGHLLVLGGPRRAQLHTAHWQGLFPRVLPARAAAPGALGGGLQRVGQLGP